MSVLMSSPGPLIVGIGLTTGKSSTQMADFIRRSSELMAIVVSYVVYSVTTKDGFDAAKKAGLERNTDIFVGLAMILGGGMMLISSLLSSDAETGNVLPGLCVAVLGVIANFIFWRRYTRLGKAESNSILLVQSRLYRAKTIVDMCVSIALGSLMLFPETTFSYYLDKVATAIVCVYLMYTGIKTVRERIKR